MILGVVIAIQSFGDFLGFPPGGFVKKKIRMPTSPDS